MEDDTDDMYAPEEGSNGSGMEHEAALVAGGASGLKTERTGDDLEEGEEEGEEVEEDESDSDIDIITERKDINKPNPPQTQRLGAVKVTPARTSSADPTIKQRKSPAPSVEPIAKVTPQRPGSSYPAIKTSKIDLDAKPKYEANGKPITEIDMDADFPEDDKPWRRPGTDVTDFFNYGFDEFTWASYCLKQTSLRKEIADSKKQMEDMQNFLGMPTGLPPLPNMPGAPAPAQAGVPAMGGPSDLPPEMQQMMQQMMSQGIDPSQMDYNMFMQMMQGQPGANGNQAQNFGGGQGFGQQGQNQQPMGFGGFGSSGRGGGGTGGAGGAGGGRNQGQNRRNW